MTTQQGRLMGWRWVTLGLGLLASTAVAGSGRMNVLFISADDMRFELGAYGAPQVHTPNLDRLAALGAIFLQAHCQYPQCAPSRSSVMTGRRPDTTRVYDVYTHFRPALPDVVTLPELFKQHGYATQGLGKVYHSNLDDPASWTIPHWKPDLPPLQYVNPETSARMARKREEAARTPGLTPRQRAQAAYGPAWESEDAPDSAYHDGQVTDHALAALEDFARHQQSFFLAVGYRKPHLPFTAPQRFFDLYDPAALTLAPNPQAPEGAPSYGPRDGGEFRSYEDMPVWPAPLPEREARRLKHAYYACISFVDAQVGRLLAELDRLGIAKNTLVVFWSDHGYHLGEQSHWGKWSPYEWDSRSPLILCGPGVPAGTATDSLVEFVDIYPTVTELAGLPLADGLEGVSMVPLLHDPDRRWKTAVFTQVLRLRPEGDLMAVTMRTERYRLTRWSDEGDSGTIRAWELYDHVTDPDETHNVADDPAYAGARADLLKQLDVGWRAALPQP
jgi:iduronate 2-sulfatase